MKQILLLIFLPVSLTDKKIKGMVTDNMDNLGLPGVKIVSSEGIKATGKVDGTFSITYTALPVQLIFSC